MEDLKTFLIEKVLTFESDTLSPETEKVLQQVRREKTIKPVIFVSSGTSSVIAGAEKTYSAIETYIAENEPSADLVGVGCTGPATFEPLVCIQIPGKNELFFRNITEEKVEPLLNGVFHNDINDEDLAGQTGTKGFELWPGIPFMDELPFFSNQKRIILGNCGCYDPESIEEYIARGGYRAYIKAIRHYTFEEVCDIIARSRLQKAIDRARDFGLFGHNIFSSGYNLDIIIRIEPGAFVCGEETALINTLEGKRGMPQLKPPYPTSAGLFGKPTVINNVETLMNVPLIMQNGPEWFRTLGTENSPGTKVFAVAGKGRMSGVVEIEMVTTIRTILEDIADGIRGGKEFKAIQLGGVSGSFITNENLDIAVDYENLKEKGIGMGAGGFVIIDENTCMVDLVRYYMEFIRNESCGKCIPCREGTGRMLEILESVIRKPLNEESGTTLERFKGVMQLETIASVMKDTSLCGLGQTAPNPFISALINFRDEFEEHIFDRKCRANICRGLRMSL